MASNTRGLVKSMTLIGSAQAVSIVLTILRIKALAVLLGPAGIGLLSVFQTLLDTVRTAAGLGLNVSGVRQIARTKSDFAAQKQVRKVLIAAHWIQGVIALGALWFLKTHISLWLFGTSDYAVEVVIIGAAVLVALIGTALLTILQGLRRIGDFGKVTVAGALAGTVFGVAAVWIWGEAGLIWFVTIQPAAMLLAVWYYTRRLPKISDRAVNAANFWNAWKPMASLGIAFMLGGLASTATLLFARGLVTQELGLAAAGQFAAAWGITMTYVGFLLTAMRRGLFSAPGRSRRQSRKRKQSDERSTSVGTCTRWIGIAGTDRACTVGGTPALFIAVRTGRGAAAMADGG